MELLRSEVSTLDAEGADRDAELAELSKEAEYFFFVQTLKSSWIIYSSVRYAQKYQESRDGKVVKLRKALEKRQDALNRRQEQYLARTKREAEREQQHKNRVVLKIQRTQQQQQRWDQENIRQEEQMKTLKYHTEAASQQQQSSELYDNKSPLFLFRA